MLTSFLLTAGRFMALMVFLHPIHISVTEIEFDQKEKALEIMMRVFIDDLEVSLKDRFDQPDLDLFDRANADKLDELMRPYLADHFRITLDGKPAKINYLGHEQEPDVFIFYIEVENVKRWEEIDVRNTIIMETYNDQSNLVNVAVGETIKSLRLTRDTPNGTLSFED